MGNNRIQLVISGVSLTVSTDEDDAYVRRIAETVDLDMQMLLNKTKASVTSAALLLAVDYLDRFQKSNRSATNMRTQIKGYLADAAGAKLLYDEEKKLSGNLRRELDETRNRAEQPKRDDINALVSECNSLRVQLENANKMLRAADTVSRDTEIRRLGAEQREHLDHIGSQTQKISALEQQIEKQQKEIERLLEEMKILEDMISEDAGPASIPGFPPVPPASGSVSVNDPDKAGLENGYENLPPLYRPDPAGDATYSFEDLPNLKWTDDI